MALIPEVETSLQLAQGCPFYWLKKPPMKEVLRSSQVVFETAEEESRLLARESPLQGPFAPYKGAPELRPWGREESARSGTPWRKRQATAP